MSERRTRRYIGQVQRVFIYRGPVPENGMAVADLPRGSGQFFFDGKTVHFHEDDAKLKKEIIYESVEQIQRTTRGKDKVKLRP